MGTHSGVELRDLALSSERLIMRPWRREDVPAVHEAMQDRSIHEFLILPDPYTRADAVEYVSELALGGRQTGTGLGCALVETATGHLVGSADLRLPGPRAAAAEIGYAIYASARGRGYASEASRTLAAWAFEHEIGRVEIRCAVANLASAKSALNAGFRYEGTLRDSERTPAGLVDGAVFGRVADDAGEPIAPAFVPLPPDGLSDGVLAIRPVEAADADALAGTEDAVTIEWGFTGRAHPPAEVYRSAARAGLDWLVGTAAPFAMVDVVTGRCAGSLRVRLAGPPNVGGIGYVVHPEFRGRGATTRALRLVARWAFDLAGFARLELGAKEGNAASLQAARRAGFEPDGVHKSRQRNPDGTFSDEVRFALVNPRYRSEG